MLYILLKQKESFINKNKWAVIQFDNRPLTDEYKLLVEKNKEYCKKHNYTHIFEESKYENIPPYWIKVFMANDILTTKHENNEYLYDGIFWIDTDAVIHNHDIPIHMLSNKSFFCSPDPDYLGPSNFNAGVWGVRNTEQGRAILNEWIQLYNNIKSNWTKNGDSWSGNGEWAGEIYEQGAFNKFILNSEKYKDNIEIFPYQKFQSINLDKSDIFTLHFSLKRNDALKDYINIIK